MKGVAYILITLIIVMMIIPIVYVIGGYVVSRLYTAVNTTDIITPFSKTVLEHIMTVWDYWPVIAIIVCLVWAVLEAQRREPWWERSE